MRIALFSLLMIPLAVGCGDGDKEKPGGDEDDSPIDDEENPNDEEENPNDEEEPPLDNDGDGSPVEVDCDDDNANVFPGAPELCDQQANDCDTLSEWTVSEEAGTAMFTNSEGSATDLTSAITGTEVEPETVIISEAGQLDLCEGTFYAALEISADLDIVTHGEVALSGAEQATILALLAEDITVSASSIVLQDGLATFEADITDDYTGAAGGAIHSNVNATVELQDVVFRNNVGDWAGAIFAGNEAAVRGINITAEGNTSASGAELSVATFGATLDLESLTSSSLGSLGIYAFESFIIVSDADMQDYSTPIYGAGSNVVIEHSTFSGSEYGISFNISERYYSNVDITDSNFSSNETALFQYGGELSITNSDFIGNSGEVTSGVQAELVDLSVTNSRFIDNVSTTDTAALNVTGGSIEVHDSAFIGNQSGEYLAAAWLRAGEEEDSQITVSGSSFAANEGGALHIRGGYTASLSNLLFLDNLGEATLEIDNANAASASNLSFENNEGTAIEFFQASGEVSGVTITGQDAEYYAGLHVFYESTVTADDIEVSPIEGSDASLIHVDGDSSAWGPSNLTLSNATLLNGKLAIRGGAELTNVTIDGSPEQGIDIRGEDATLTATGLTVRDAEGSCLYSLCYDCSVWPSISLEDTDFDSCSDAAIYLGEGRLTATELAVRNSTGPYTGGIYLADSCEATLIDSTIEGNSTESSYYAGGVALAGDGSFVTLDNVDFIENTAAGTPADLSHSFFESEVLGLGYSGSCGKDIGCTSTE